LFAEAVEFGLEGLPADWVEYAVDGEGAAPRDRRRQVPRGVIRVGVVVGSCEIGAQLPVLDALVGYPEERSPGTG